MKMKVNMSPQLYGFQASEKAKIVPKPNNIEVTLPGPITTHEANPAAIRVMLTASTFPRLVSLIMTDPLL